MFVVFGFAVLVELGWWVGRSVGCWVLVGLVLLYWLLAGVGVGMGVDVVCGVLIL